MRAWAKSFLPLPLFVLYIFLGAFAFHKLEEGQSAEARGEFFQYLALFTQNHSQCMLGDELISFLQLVAVARAEGVISPSAVHDEGIKSVWSWPNSIVFAATIVTTVGYGRLVPKTVSGQIFCIVFAIVGIPLCYIMLSVVGDTFQSLWQYSIRLFDKAACCVTSQGSRKALGGLVTCIVLWAFLVMIPAAIFVNTEAWSLIDAQYFSFVSLSTIGFGDIIYGMEDRLVTVRQDWLYKIGMLVYFLIGLSVISIVFKGVWRAQKERLKLAQRTTRRFWQNRGGRHGSYSLGTLPTVDEAPPQCTRSFYKRNQSTSMVDTAESSDDEAMEVAMSMDAMERNRRSSSVFTMSYRTVTTLCHLADQDSSHGFCNHSLVEEVKMDCDK